MRRWQIGLAGALLTGILLTALFPVWSLSFLAPIALSPLIYSLAYEPSAKRRFLWGWVAGTVFWGLTCHWIQDVLLNYGGLTGPLSWFALLLFAVAKGLLLGLFAALAGLVLPTVFAIPAIAALWVGIERLNGPQGFAWLALGNAGIEMGLPLRLAPFAGVYGLSFVFAALGTAACLMALGRPRRELLWLLPLAGLAALPGVQLDKAPSQTAAVLQPAVKDNPQWSDEERVRAFRQFSVATLANAIDPSSPRPALIVWPEVPAPFYYYDDPVFREHVTRLARTARAPFLFGTVAFTPGRAPLNSAVFLTEEGRLAGRYDKINLVPFGEFIPPAFGWIEKISSEAGNYEPGRGVSVFDSNLGAVGAFICYESAFPGFVRQFANGGASVLVNLTNDGYFGSGAARPQHLLLARMRAVENRRWILRVANDGVTAAIDPAGRLWDRQAEFKSLAARLRFDWITAKTFYTRHGDWFAWLCLAVSLGACLGVFAQTPRVGS